MKEYPLSVFRADESWGYATAYYSTGPTVTVEITGINSPGSNWRIRGRGSDQNVYLSGQGLGTYTFDSDNNMNYVFQIQNWNGTWVNTSQGAVQEENSLFSVVFESGSGDSGGGGYVGANTMFINPGEGTKITVYRTWSDDEANRHQYLAKEVTESTTVTIYYPNDRFHILAEALPGYKIDYYYDSDGDSFPYYTDNLSKFWTNDYDGAWRYQPIYDLSVSIDATATRYSCVRIDDGTDDTNFGEYLCYIDTDYGSYTQFDLYIPYIDNGTSWEPL